MLDDLAVLQQPWQTLGATGVAREFSVLGALDWGDLRPALQVAQLAGETDDRVILAAALTVKALRKGSVCLDFSRVTETVFDVGEEAIGIPDTLWPEPTAWQQALLSSPCVHEGADGEHDRPLRWVAGRLYLERYWREERRVEDQIRNRRSRQLSPAEWDRACRMAHQLGGPNLSQEQVRAAATAWTSFFTVLAGGPGTGKTTTIGTMIGVLRALGGERLAIALAAPTGKAATRMKEALVETPGSAGADLQSSTIHSLLKWNPVGQPQFNASNPLPHDVIIVDETSMVSLVIMSALLSAARLDARVIMVGDPHQLDAIDAGAVFTDIVGANDDEPAGDHRMNRRGVVTLRHNYRSTPDITRFAEAINAGATDEVTGMLRQQLPGIEFTEVNPDLPADPQLTAALQPALLAQGRIVLDSVRAGNAKLALSALRQHRILCGHRTGPWGVSNANRLAEHWLETIGWRPGHGEFYLGRPILITRNLREMNLFNGDVGVVMGTGPQARIHIDGPDPEYGISPFLLTDIQTVWAMTIHKSQGSQFDEVSIVLPPADSLLLSRALLYTAVTRAKKKVRLVGSLAAVRAAVERQVHRVSGLRDRL